MEIQTRDLSNKVSLLPDLPGVYLMKDAAGEIIYIGKASSLKKRVSSYFQKSDLDTKTRVLVRNIADFEYIVTDSEIEALLLESSLIKKHKPKFNVRLKDDKRYPYIAITLSEEYPRVIFTRKVLDNGNRYFGPYTDARAARKNISTINATFKLRTCTKNLPLKPHVRPCLNYQMGRCTGVCMGKMTREDYLKIVDTAGEFLEGRIDPVISGLNDLMGGYAGRLEYEKAAQVRDIISDIHKISESQNVFSPVGTDQDYIGMTIENREAVLVLFEFRGGALLGRKIFIFENVEYSQPSGIVQTFIIDYYRKAEVPLRIIIPFEIEDRETLTGYLTGLSSKKVSITTPKTADDNAVSSMIRKNIAMIIADRASSRQFSNKEKGLSELKTRLGMEEEPRIIECFDISNIMGRLAVASMVRFADGIPDKKNYRRYRIRAFGEANDPGMIHEAVSRRLQYLVNEGMELPDLVVIDGGKTQLTRAMEARDALGPGIRFISLAKRFEEIYFDPEAEPLRLPETSPALQIIQNLRDEAHRFAVTYHRLLRGKEASRSLLDEIPGIGEKSKRIILSHLKEPAKLPGMPLEDLEAIPGLGKSRALAIYGHFHPK